MKKGMNDIIQRISRWLGRTPVQTFILCPLVVSAFELAWHLAWHLAWLGGKPIIAPWGLMLMAWGYAQYHLVGRYRHPRAGGSAGMETPPDRILAQGPYRYTRNPMYLGHLIFLTGLAITLWSWFGLIVLAARAAWLHRRVLQDEGRLKNIFGAEYVAYRGRVKRWIPGMFS